MSNTFGIPIGGGYTPKFKSTDVLGGPFNGYSPQQTQTNYKDSENVMTRRVVVKSWNGNGAAGTYGSGPNTQYRVVTPFRAVNNLGDFLGRQNYVCGGPNQVNRTFPGRQGRFGSIISQCDNTGVPANSGNNRFVPDSSDYVKFKKQRAMNQNYNDLGSGGDVHNASFVARMAVHRGIRAI
jgi:hypothetical protein